MPCNPVVEPSGPSTSAWAARRPVATLPTLATLRYAKSSALVYLIIVCVYFNTHPARARGGRAATKHKESQNLEKPPQRKHPAQRGRSRNDKLR